MGDDEAVLAANQADGLAAQQQFVRLWSGARGAGVLHIGQELCRFSLVGSGKGLEKEWGVGSHGLFGLRFQVALEED